MKEFDYDLDYKKLDFTDEETRKLYRIGRGEQGVLLVRPYTHTICNHWRFKTPREAIISSNRIYGMYLDYRDEKDFIGMDMCRKFLEMGFTRARRYANHHSGTKYNDDGSVKPQESDHWECHYNQSAQIFKKMRDKAAYDPEYKRQRTIWRSNESTYATRVDTLAATSNVKRTRYSRRSNEVHR